MIFSLLISLVLISIVMSDKPKLAGRLPTVLPPKMTSNKIGTWAHSTMSKRIIDDIFTRLIEDNSAELTRPTSSLRAECFLQLNDLKASVLSGTSGFLRGVYDEGHDVETWNNLLMKIPESERNWLDAPWLITEFYFYRRIIEAFKFYETGYDMFVTQKSAGLKSCIPQVNQVSLRLPLLLDAKSVVDKSAAIKTLILTSLWGNKADLSLWPALKDTTTTTNENKSNPSAYADTMSYVLDDHLDAVVNRLSDISRSNSKVVSIVVDNAGYELVTDLLLGYGLIKLGIADKIVFHTKAHPTFVSDATTIDCVETINYLRTEEPCPAIVSIGSELYNMCQSNQIEFQDDVFWCQPIEFWNMPDSIIQKISNHKMVFVKGDANYRRLLGERTWSLDTPASTVLSYWPVPVCALRTFKAEIGCGISDKMVEKTQSSDEQWMVSGKWGVIQLGGPDIV